MFTTEQGGSQHKINPLLKIFKEIKVKKMFNYPIEKYQFYTTKNKVVAVSTYAGKTVRGIAKADPRDNFDLEAGKKLAAARCAARIAMKRKSRAQKEFDKARDAYEKAQARFEKMNLYWQDSKKAAVMAEAEVTRILNEL